MPWDVKRDDRCPAEKPWGVVKQGDESLEGCHMTQAMAKEQQKALYANEPGAKPMTETRARRWGEDGGLYVADLEFRAGTDGAPQFSGYAALFDIPSDAPWLPFTETIRPGAFSEALRAKGDHSFVVNHDDHQLLASTRTGRLRLSEDKRGLLVDADLPNTSTAHDLRALYDAGEVRGMSFSFKPTRGGIVQTDKGRELTNVKLGHVTAVTTLIPGYSQTANTIQMRALASDISASPDDLDEVLDAVRAGRPLTPDEVDLLARLVDHLRPPSDPVEPETRAIDVLAAAAAHIGRDLSDVPGAEPGAA